MDDADAMPADTKPPVIATGDSSPDSRPSAPNRVITGPVRTALLALALPVLGEQILNTFVGLFDVWLAGRISPAATSAVGLGAYTSWLVSIIVMLVATGTTALVSRHKGANLDDEANRDANQSVTLAAILGVALCVLLFELAPWFARYTAMRGEAFGLTVRYLRVDALGHIFLSVTLVGCAALRGVGDMRTPLLMFTAVNAVNIVASSVMVFVMDWGVYGIVGGTLIARFVGFAILLVVLLRGRSGLRLRRRMLGIAWERTRRILRIGMPAAADGAIMWSGHFAFLAIVARVATDELGRAGFAAHIVAVRVEAFTYLPAIAWAMAAATMIGQSLGAGDTARARRTGHEAALQCGLLAIGIAAFFHFGAGWIYAQMSADPLVSEVGVRPFKVLALLQPFLAVSIVYIGGMRGAGDTRAPMLITVIGVLVRLPVGYLFGIVWGGGLFGAWIGMFGDMIWRGIAATARYVGGRWLRTEV